MNAGTIHLSCNAAATNKVERFKKAFQCNEDCILCWLYPYRLFCRYLHIYRQCSHHTTPHRSDDSRCEEHLIRSAIHPRPPEHCNYNPENYRNGSGKSIGSSYTQFHMVCGHWAWVCFFAHAHIIGRSRFTYLLARPART